MELSSVAFLFWLGLELWRKLCFRFGCCWLQALGCGFGWWIISIPFWHACACLLAALPYPFTRQGLDCDSKSVLAPVQCCAAEEEVDLDRILQALPSSLDVVSASARYQCSFTIRIPETDRPGLAGKRLSRCPASSLLFQRNAQDAGAQHKVTCRRQEQLGRLDVG